MDLLEETPERFEANGVALCGVRRLWQCCGLQESGFSETGVDVPGEGFVRGPWLNDAEAF
jgi:hypothetical protein